MGLIDTVFGTYSKRQLKKIESTCKDVEALYDKYKNMSDAELRGVTAGLKKRLADGEELDDILPDAFAAVVETSDRVLHKRLFRVQVIGGIILHQGRIAEMKTGEGKTFVAALPAYLNALTGNGVHIVTVNDYLARYGSEIIGKIYNFLGLSVGLITHDSTSKEHQIAYNADITYGTNNEMGFDYLRDNMVLYKEDMVQRGHAFAIIDEVDSILIDEARTPLIISGEGEESTDLYEKVDKVVKEMRPYIIKEMDSKESYEDVKEDYIVDEKARTAVLTKNGIKKAESKFGIENLSDPENAELNHHINVAIKARGTFKREVDYVVNEDNQVLIVDTFTGRLMPGRRYSDGLHQAIEAKEGVKIKKESKTLATITFQNYFRLYKKLSGMTGTALTEENEFREIYKLDVVEIPTHRPMIREDHNDMVYLSVKSKYKAIVKQIKECHEKSQPVLVGTVSVDRSEYLSKLLKEEGIEHNVLNAKHHEKEAEIIAQAGMSGAVTIATNMAGRGTDIMLGGNTEFMAAVAMRAEIAQEVHDSNYKNTKLKKEEAAIEKQITLEVRKKIYAAVTEQESENLRQSADFIEASEEEKTARLDNLRKNIRAAFDSLNSRDNIRDVEVRQLRNKIKGLIDSALDEKLGRSASSNKIGEHITGAKDKHIGDRVAEAFSYFETDDEQILEDRKRAAEKIKHFENEFAGDAEKVRKAGGLFVLGTERHDSRRIDNQLGGRSGRQGDAGESRFFISFDDDLLRLYGGDSLINRVRGMVSKLTSGSGGESDDIQLPPMKIVSNGIAGAQKRIEGHHFESRKHTLRYDDVVNQQRKIIYEQRRQVLDGANVKDRILEMIQEVISESVREFCVGEDQSEWNFKGLREHFKSYNLIEENDFVFEFGNEEDKFEQDADDIAESLVNKAKEKYNKTESDFAENVSKPVFIEVEEIAEEDGADYKAGDKIIRILGPKFLYIEQIISNGVVRFCSDKNIENWNLEGLKNLFKNYELISENDFDFGIDTDSKDNQEIIVDIIKTFVKKAEENEDIRKKIASEQMREYERSVLLGNVDENWIQHIDAMQDLKDSIGLRAYAQRDPIVDFRMEGAEMFNAIIQNIKAATVRKILTIPVPKQTVERRRIVRAKSESVGGNPASANAKVKKRQPVIKKEKIGRNEPCPCGSRKSDGSPKKYKNCCGANSSAEE